MDRIEKDHFRDFLLRDDVEGGDVMDWWLKGEEDPLSKKGGK